MSETQRKSIIVLDANAFISCSKIAQFGKNHRLITTSDVLAELKDEKTKTYLQNLPYEIEQKDFQPKSLEIVKEFAKKTGDIGSLSDVDLQLIALAHTLYVAQGLASKIRKQPPPIVQKNVEAESQNNQSNSQSQYDEQSQTEQPLGDDQGWVTVPTTKKNQQQDVDSDLDQEQGWVTPKNYQTKMIQINTAFLQKKQEQKNEQEKNQLTEQKQYKPQFSISLISADYAIQNVSTQLGIKLIAMDGRVISSIRRFIWECYLCWQQYKIAENKVKLCSNCGYNSLSKVAYSMDSNGNATLHRKKGWKPNLKVQEWKEKKFQKQQKAKKHQHERRTKKASIFDNV